MAAATPTTEQGTIAPSTTSLADRYRQAVSLVESSPETCVDQLQAIQHDLSLVALFSDNETLDDVSTPSLPLLALEHMLATALVNLPTTPPDAMKKRKVNLLRSSVLWAEFLRRLEVLEILSKDETNEFHALLEAQQGNEIGNDDSNGEIGGNNHAVTPQLRLLPPHPNRDVKIARFKAKKQLEQEIQRLKALQERRNRFNVADEDDMDGHDLDSLRRSLALAELDIYRGQALENWAQTLRELPIIERMVQVEVERQQTSRHATNRSTSNGGTTTGDPRLAGRPNPPPNMSNQPLKVTRITKDSMTGQLHVKKDEIRSKVFQPGWNQPTMSLEELGEREYHAAMEREERQKQAEAEQKKAPRRYEQLLKDGMEDNADLVDASAQLDREWDAFKDENPRGSGNKMGNRGDKNF